MLLQVDLKISHEIADNRYLAKRPENQSSMKAKRKVNHWLGRAWQCFDCFLMQVLGGQMSTPTSLVRHAGFWIRFTAYAVDCVVVYVGVVLVLTAIGVDTTDTSVWMLAAVHSMFELDAVLIWLLYDVGFWVSPWQATPGKRLLGLRVTNLHYRKITLPRAITRYATSFLSAVLLCIGYFLIAFTDKKRALHDLLAGTFVIHASSVDNTDVSTLDNLGGAAQQPNKEGTTGRNQV